MLRKLSIHVGFEKTGTTSVQNYLAKRFSSEHEGICYPKFGRNSTHHYEVYMAAKDRTFRLDAPNIAAELQTESLDHVVLSCEHFSFLETASTEALLYLIGHVQSCGWAVTLVANVRDSYDYMRSLYNEAVKWGETEAFHMFIVRMVHRLWASRIAHIGLETGCDTVFVRYRADVNENLKITLLAIDPRLVVAETEPAENANVSLRQEATSILLYVNRLFQNVGLTRELIGLLNKYRHLPVVGGMFNKDDLELVSAEGYKKVHAIENSDFVRRELFLNGRGYLRIRANGAGISYGP